MNKKAKLFTVKMPDKLRIFFLKNKYILLVAIVGVTLLLIRPGGSDVVSTVEQTVSEGFDLDEFEAELSTILSKTAGVGKVRVMLTLNSTMETVYANERRMTLRETETTTDETIESEPSVISGGSKGSTAMVIRENYPDFRGAVVICEGGDNATVRLSVIEAVSALTGISTDRITVMKMNG